MARLACIDLPAFPLQLLLRRHQKWRDHPAAVVEEDKPLARILWINERARRFEILPGMRYAAGLALASNLCAGVVPESEIADGVAFVTKRLRRFSPDIEPAPQEPGVFWVDASGLGFLDPSIEAWGQKIFDDLREHDFAGRIAVGFDRFGTYALARSCRGPHVVVLKSPEAEQAWTKKVRLDRLHLEPQARDTLDALGIKTVGDLVRLPAGSLLARYGQEILGLHQSARRLRIVPLEPQPAEESLRQELWFDFSERDVGRLLFGIKGMLDALLKKLVSKHRAIAELFVELKLEDGQKLVERLQPAEPTVDGRKLLNLVLLRLEATRLSDGVVELAVDAQHLPATHEQLSLFSRNKSRDLRAAKEAFARLRAEMGPDAVVCARLCDAHMPEGAYEWTPAGAIPFPEPQPLQGRTLVRRIYRKPILLPHRPRHEDDGWQLRGRTDAAVDMLCGPYVVSGGWWRSEVFREYHFVHNQKGEWLWTFYDRDRRRWFLQGEVE